MPPRVWSFLPSVALAGALLLVFLPPAGAVDDASFKRRDQRSAEDLLQMLDDVPVIGLGKSAQTVLNAYTARIRREKQQLAGTFFPIVDASPLLEIRPDFINLSLRLGDSSMVGRRSAVTLGVLSRKLHKYLDTDAPIDENGRRPELQRLCAALQTEMRGKKPEWLRPEAVPTLTQMLAHEDKPVRLMLVNMLQGIPGRASTTALARRAVFDVDPEVRQTAVAALRERSRPDSRRLFVEALRYPWPPAADHAAEALVNLGDRAAVGQLVALLDKPDPQEPQSDGKGGSTVREMSRIHHQSNCILCHTPASSAKDPVTGPDPILTVTSVTGVTAGGGGGWGGGGGTFVPTSANTSPLLVRADVAFLRQDFSLLQSMPASLASLRRPAGPLAAAVQRFDFVVRKRPISKKELDRRKETTPQRDTYPQQESVLFALRELTGRDEGKTYAAWLDKYPDAVEEAKAAKLSDTLCDARTAPRREQLLVQYRDTKGLAYTLALAQSVARIEGPFQDKLREAIVKRLARMTPATLQERLRDEDPELRRAAVVALAQKRESDSVSYLIPLLGDKEADVVDAAVSGLRDLTGKPFSSPEEWQRWWSAAAAIERQR
jgi:hypothetical protein